VAGFEAMKLTGWRMRAFTALAVILALIGALWPWIKALYPPITRWVAKVATDPYAFSPRFSLPLSWSFPHGGGLLGC
jgi:hypothetical protein